LVGLVAYTVTVWGDSPSMDSTAQGTEQDSPEVLSATEEPTPTIQSSDVDPADSTTSTAVSSTTSLPQQVPVEVEVDDRQVKVGIPRLPENVTATRENRDELDGIRLDWVGYGPECAQYSFGIEVVGAESVQVTVISWTTTEPDCGRDRLTAFVAHDQELGAAFSLVVTNNES